MSRKNNSWKQAWDGREMDRWVREEKAQAKKKKHKDNRRNCKDALRKGDFDSADVMDWDDLDANDVL